MQLRSIPSVPPPSTARQVRQVLSFLPSVADMKRCIERRRNRQGGGIAFPPTPTEISEAYHGLHNNPGPAGAAPSSNGSSSGRVSISALNAVAANTAQTAANAAANAAALAASNPNAVAAVRAAQQTAVKVATDAAKAAAAVAAAVANNGMGVSEGGNAAAATNWDHADATVLSLREALSEKSPLSYLLLRWLLSA